MAAIGFAQPAAAEMHQTIHFFALFFGFSGYS
jgi:hypothetical protein